MFHFTCFRARFVCLLIVAAMCLAAHPLDVFPQTPELKFTYLTREQGLSSSSVISIIQDYKGYMWFGTVDGLNRYDGYQMTVYKNNSGNPFSLSNNYINQLLEDKKHRIWIATNYGLNVYDRKQNRFYRYISKADIPASLSSNNIRCLFEDAKGNIWIGTSMGLNLFNEHDGTFKHFMHTKNLQEHIVANIINCIYENNGKLWVGTDGAGIKQFNPLNGCFTTLDYYDQLNRLNDTRISTIKKTPDGDIWIGSVGNGVFLYQQGINTMVNYTQGKDRQSLSNNVVKSILCDHRQNIWIATENGGVNLYQPQSGTFSHYENQPENQSSLSQKTASSLFEDRQHNLWVGTHRGGVNLYTPNGYKFEKHGQGNSATSLSYKDVKTFFEDAKGNIWIGTDGGGINVWDKLTHKFRQYRHNENDPNSIGSDAILHIMQDHTGTIWIGTWGGGLNRFNSATGTFTRYLHNTNDQTSISSNNVWRIHEDQHGVLWVATFYAGLNSFDSKSGKFTRITTAPDKKTKFIGAQILMINEDHKGNLWFCTEDGGLNYLNNDHKYFRHYFIDNQKDSTDPIRTLFIDSKNRVWAGKTGLYLFNQQKNNFTLFSANPYLINERIQAILEDDKGNLWISTNNGLLQFNPETGHLKRFTDADGLQSLEFCQNACLKTRLGKFLFGGFQGFNIFNPDSIKNDNYTYPVYITGLLLFNKYVQQGTDNSPINEDITETRRISLDHNQSVFSLEYAALNYVAPAKTQYAYKLLGFDKGWNYVGTQRKATYTNLDPGSYTFKVKASSPDGLWNTPATSIMVNIKPPFWLTWWFKTITIILLGFTVFIILYYRRKAELKAFNEQKKEEIHQLQLQFFTNISHEFRTPLTMILGTLDQVSGLETGSTLSRHYHTIRRNANRLVNLISELMDFRKSESGILKLKVMPGNLSIFLTEIMQEFNELALLQKIEFTVQQNLEHDEIWFDRQVVEKILLNIINNAFKYTPQMGSVRINVSSSFQIDQSVSENQVKVEHSYKGLQYIYFSITDTGIGISKNSIDHLFERYFRVSDHHLGSGIGLAFVKSLTFLHKGHIYVYSKYHQGTQIIIAIPCNKADYASDELWLGDARATSVQLESVQYQERPYQVVADNNHSSSDISAEKECILIVDDNDELRAYLKEVLEPLYRIIEAENGASGIEKAKQQSPSLIISDVMMPVMDGNEFCRYIKDDFETSHIPFILLTAKDSLQSRLEGMEFGADYYFSKPLSTQLLLVTIKNIFKQKLKLKEQYIKDYQTGVRELVHSAKDKTFMDQLIHIIEQKLEDPDLDVDYVSREIGVSKSKLYKKITDITGQSINEFVRMVRLKKAVQIMTHEDVLITEVMYRVGILSQSYFTSIFKKEFDMTPSQFKRQLDGKRLANNKKRDK